MINKKTIFALAFSLFLLSASLSAFADNNLLKVGLYWGSGAKSEYGVSASSSLSVGTFSDKTFISAVETTDSSVTISKDGAYHILYKKDLSLNDAKTLVSSLKQKGIASFIGYSNGGYFAFGESYSNENDCLWAAQNLEEKGSVFAPDQNFISVKNSTGGVIFISDENCGISSSGGKLSLKAASEKEYRGKMNFFLSNGALCAANVVECEEYLYSVISKEMSPSWNKEALKAQAVCARCFAYNNKNKHSKQGFELCDTVCCQAYAGTSSETENSYAPVNETNGQYLLYNGKVCETFYCSSMGPTTENVKYVWGSEYPYLISVENPYEDYENVYNGKWEKTLTKQRATEIMNSKGYDIGDVVEIKALEYSPSKRVIKLSVKGTKGEKIFEKDACRSVFSEVTPSLYFTISGGGEKVYPTVSLRSSSQNVSKAANNIKIVSDKGTFSANTICAIGGDGKKSYSPASADSSAYTFSGYGWGHGIGMSQYGAKGMADAGFGYVEILTHYFPGTTVGKIGN